MRNASSRAPKTITGLEAAASEISFAFVQMRVRRARIPEAYGLEVPERLVRAFDREHRVPALVAIAFVQRVHCQQRSNRRRTA